MNSDEIVEALQPFGVVRVYQFDKDKTFSATVCLFMHGMSAEVSSDYKHRTMNSALAQLHERVMAVVNTGLLAKQITKSEEV